MLKKRMIYLYAVLIVTVCIVKKTIARQHFPLKEMTPWQEGYLDIHQISTGRGNCAFLILPDGTTLMIDVGDMGNTKKIPQEIMPALPNNTRLPAEWIARYVTHFSQPLPRKGELDYVLLTHYHMDHMGGSWDGAPKAPQGNYLLSGITQLPEFMKIKKIIDRGWPDYNYPSRKDVEKATTDFGNYLRFLDWQMKNNALQVERFEVGSDEQFTLKNAPEKFPGFRIRNIYSSGKIWDGKTKNSKDAFPDLINLTEDQYPNENMCSNVIKLSYGKFDYYSGGDLTGILHGNSPSWRDVETAVGSLVGPVEVMVADHHAYSDAQNNNIIRKEEPQVYVLPVWDYYHPQPEVLTRMLDTNNYSGKRSVFATGLVEGNRRRLGPLSENIEQAGHILIRVYPGGDSFRVFVMEPYSEEYKVTYESSLFHSK